MSPQRALHAGLQLKPTTIGGALAPDPMFIHRLFTMWWIEYLHRHFSFFLIFIFFYFFCHFAAHNKYSRLLGNSLNSVLCSVYPLCPVDIALI